MKKFKAAVIAISVMAAMITGCSSNNNTPESSAPAESSGIEVPEGNEMQYVTDEELLGAIEDYVILDVRKAGDYDAAHITGAYSADVDAARNGDDEDGIANLKAALKDATGSEDGSDDANYVLVCYSGKAYAQKATDLLVYMGVDSDSIYTLEGGFNGWSEAGDDYTALID